MNLIRLLPLLAALPVLAPAATVYFIDPFGAAATSCDLPSCDVIGDPVWFDLDRIALTFDPVTSAGQLAIQLNFGPNTDLSPFDDFGIHLDAADVFFTANGTIRYGIPLTTHSGVTAGHLYDVLSPSGVLTAFQVLNLGSDYAYRPDAPVWLRDDGSGAVVNTGTGSVSSAVTGDGLTSGHLTVTIMFVATPALLADLQANLLGVTFASATCGNDIIYGQAPSLDQIPEPTTWALLLTGLAVLGCYRRQVAAPIMRRVLRS